MTTRKPVQNLIIGAGVQPVKKQAARDLRKEMTAEEVILWQAIRNEQIPGLRFRKQVVIKGFIVDFYCHSAALVIEVDGPIHEAQTAYDRERDAALSGLGLRVVRVTNAQVREELPGVVETIRREAHGG